MKKLALLLLVCICQTAAFSQALIPDTLTYSSARKLSWSVFQAAVDENPTADKAELPVTLVVQAESRIRPFHKAELATTISMVHTHTNALTGVATFKARAYVYRDRSWVFPAYIEDSGVLAHAQLHFDIAELYARKLEHEINSRKINGNNRIKMEAIFHSHYSQMRQEQKQCDADTQGGAHPGKQREWERKIQSQLASLPRGEYPAR